eukprot:TRINITY_DN1748_c0_g1_i1.p1 TRINITY_DN1748_c0_g1~~TRINITY_DN1748_c0_g1_i1.p1  ORF type:complete len:349 (-),score=89.18 TRINITY_DN1748_c0_g1_i1:71-1117(-)
MRQHHESGAKHKENMALFFQNQRTKKQEDSEVARGVAAEIRQATRVAMGQYASDMKSGSIAEALQPAAPLTISYNTSSSSSSSSSSFSSSSSSLSCAGRIPGPPPGRPPGPPPGQPPARSRALPQSSSSSASSASPSSSSHSLDSFKSPIPLKALCEEPSGDWTQEDFAWHSWAKQAKASGTVDIAQLAQSIREAEAANTDNTDNTDTHTQQDKEDEGMLDLPPGLTIAKPEEQETTTINKPHFSSSHDPSTDARMPSDWVQVSESESAFGSDDITSALDAFGNPRKQISEEVKVRGSASNFDESSEEEDDEIEVKPRKELKSDDISASSAPIIFKKSTQQAKQFRKR